MTHETTTENSAAWITDEFGNRRWTRHGWTIQVWPGGSVDCDGPNGQDLQYDPEEGTEGGIVGVGCDAPYEGYTIASVPVEVLVVFLHVSREEYNQAPLAEGL